MIEKVKKILTNDIYFDFNSLTLIAVSGGVDSIAMLDIFSRIAIDYPSMKLAVLHYNHSLRGDSSDKDESMVKMIASKYGLEFYSVKGNVNDYAKRKNLSIEDAARDLRYKYFEKISRKINADYVATAHTSDDSAETFFINLFRGSGLTGLSGIPQKRNLVKRIMLIRPLLDFRKKELIKYAVSRKLKWREDQSNKSKKFTRNKIRLDLIPFIEENFSPSVIEIIRRAQGIFEDADSFVSHYVNDALRTIIKEKNEDRFSIKLPIFNTLDNFIKGLVLQRALNNYFHLKNIPLKTIDGILDIIKKPSGSKFGIHKDIVVLKDRDDLIFAKKEIIKPLHRLINKEGVLKAGGYSLTLKKVSKKEVKLNNDSNIEFLDWDKVPSILYIRTWNEGDSFRPLGMSGYMKLSDFFINNKITVLDKKNVLLLTSKSDIIWICGMRIADNYKISDNTDQYLKVEIKRGE